MIKIDLELVFQVPLSWTLLTPNGNFIYLSYSSMLTLLFVRNHYQVKVTFEKFEFCTIWIVLLY